MKLRGITLITVAGVFAASVIALYLISQIFLLKSFGDLEQKYARLNVERILTAVSDNLAQIETMVEDYAERDDTYDLMETMDENYIRSTFVGSTQEGLRVNIILLIDLSGRLVYGMGYDLEKKQQTPVPKSLLKHVSEDSIFCTIQRLERALPVFCFFQRNLRC